MVARWLKSQPFVIQEWKQKGARVPYSRDTALGAVGD